MDYDAARVFTFGSGEGSLIFKPPISILASYEALNNGRSAGIAPEVVECTADKPLDSATGSREERKEQRTTNPSGNPFGVSVKIDTGGVLNLVPECQCEVLTGPDFSNRQILSSAHPDLNPSNEQPVGESGMGRALTLQCGSAQKVGEELQKSWRLKQNNTLTIKLQDRRDSAASKQNSSTRHQTSCMTSLSDRTQSQKGRICKCLASAESSAGSACHCIVV